MFPMLRSMHNRLCTLQLQAARRRASRPVQAGATEVTASYSFSVLATSAAGLAPKPLQLELLQRLVGLKLPGFPRLLLVAIGEWMSCVQLLAMNVAAQCCWSCLAVQWCTWQRFVS